MTKTGKPTKTSKPKLPSAHPYSHSATSVAPSPSHEATPTSRFAIFPAQSVLRYSSQYSLALTAD